MESPEPPECPVCLQPYGSSATIPRVLACGHSVCEDCLGQLPNAYPDTIRCPACTQLVKLPKPISSLPKNIDLLRFSSLLSPPLLKSAKPLQNPQADTKAFAPVFWSREFFLHWKSWILRENCVSTEKPDDFCYLLYGCYTNCLGNDIDKCLVEKEEVGLVKVGIFVDKNENCSKFKYSYEVKVLSVLYEMDEGGRNELEMILNASLRCRGLCRVYGFWCSVDDNCVYLVCQRFRGSLRLLADAIAGECGEEKVRCMTSWVMVGLGMCEAVYDLHLQGLSIGCLGVSCFGLDEFGRAHVDICESLVAGRRAGNMIADKEAMSDENCVARLGIVNLEECPLVSPEAMFRLLKAEGVQVGCGLDVWSLACLLLWLLIGKPFGEEMQVYLRYLVTAASDEKSCDFVRWYAQWVERIMSLLVCRLKPDFIFLRELLCKCLDFNPENRPPVIELWKSLRELIVKPDFDVLTNLKQVKKKESVPHCLLFGDLCRSSRRTNRKSMDENTKMDIEEVEISKIENDVTEGIPDGQVKCIDLKAHRDCVTGFAIGGDFLFSSSYDKVVNVWSLQDFAHVHAFKGHEQRVNAVVFVDDEKPLCISGDNEGAICIWGASVPLSQEPIKKLYEQKDWRYSGIHALAVSASKHLYTGSGDKLIKAWSLQDYELSCTLTGHKSVVSSLAVCDEVLYSGSWDGTVRLWCLSDHSPLAVLGESMPENLTSVLSLAADDHALVAAHENGIVKIWFNDKPLSSIQAHNGAVFSACKSGRWIFTGGWDKTVNAQELSGEDIQTEASAFGSLSCDSVVTALLYWQGKLIVGQADGVIKVCYFAER